MQKMLILSLVVFAFLACNKNAPETYTENFPTTYSSAEWRSGPVRLFAKSGEIVDINSIGAFIERRDAGKQLYFGKQTVDSFFYQLWMKKPDTVSFFMMGVPYRCKMIQTGSTRLLVTRDTTRVYANDSYEWSPYFMRVRRGFSSMPPLYEEIFENAFPPYKVVPVFPMKRTAEGMEVTFINSLLCEPNWFPRPQIYVASLNANGHTQLAENDTVLIQERVLIMKKRNW